MLPFKTQKIISLFLVVIIVSSGFFFLKPQKTEATLPVYDYANYFLSALSWIESALTAESAYAIELKEYVLDGLAYAVAQMAVQEIVSSTVDWINTGFEGNPAFITDPEQFALDVGDNVIGNFIHGSELSFLCEPFSADVRLALLQDFTEGYEAECTLSDVVENIDNMGKRWSWNDWASLTQNTNNNAYSAYMEASVGLKANIDLKQKQAEAEVDWGQGFKPFKKCQEYCDNSGCRTRCENVTPGTAIAEQLNESLSMGGRALIAADEIDEIVGALLVQIVKSAMSSDGVRGLSRGENSLINQLRADSESIKENQPQENLDNCSVKIEGEEGSYDGSKNRSRPIFNFSREGGSYCGGGSCLVEVECTETSISKTYTVPVSGDNYDEGQFSWRPTYSSNNIRLSVLLPASFVRVTYELDSRRDELQSQADDFLIEGEGVIGGGDEKLKFEVIGTTDTTGFISLFEFNDKLYAGTYSPDTKVYSYPPWTEETSLNGGESVYHFGELNGELYAITEDQGKLFKSTDGSKFTPIFNSPYNNLGLGLFTINNNLFATFTCFRGNPSLACVSERRGPTLYGTSDGRTFFEVRWDLVNDSSCEVYENAPQLNGRVYKNAYCGGFRVSNIYSSSNGISWRKEQTYNGVKSYMINHDNSIFGIRDKRIIIKYDGEKEVDVATGTVDFHGIVAYKNNLYLSTSCWEDCEHKPRAELYQYKDNKFTKIRDFDEQGISKMFVKDDALYIATKSDRDDPNTHGKVYKMTISGDDSSASGNSADAINLNDVKEWYGGNEDFPFGEFVKDYPITSTLSSSSCGGYEMNPSVDWPEPLGNGVNAAHVACGKFEGVYKCQHWDWAAAPDRIDKHQDCNPPISFDLDGNGTRESFSDVLYAFIVRVGGNERTNVIKIK